MLNDVPCWHITRNAGSADECTRTGKPCPDEIQLSFTIRKALKEPDRAYTNPRTLVKLPPCLPQTADRGFWCPTFGRGEQLSDRQDYFYFFFFKNLN